MSLVTQLKSLNYFVYILKCFFIPYMNEIMSNPQILAQGDLNMSYVGSLQYHSYQLQTWTPSLGLSLS